MGLKTSALALFAAGLVLSSYALAEDVKTEGVIVSAGSDGYQVQTRAGPLTVVMMPETTIKEVRGLSKKDREAKTLIPGLIIKVEGDQQGQTITAAKIEFKERDWRSAIAAKAGTQEQLAELRQAIIDGNEYVIQQEATVYFKTGSQAIASQYRDALSQLAQKAPSYGNYRISILGFADPRGDAAANERLSLKRAMAVSNYLRQSGQIQPGRVLSPSAMGEGTAAPGEAAPASDDEARRVVVRIVTPKSQLQQ